MGILQNWKDGKSVNEDYENKRRLAVINKYDEKSEYLTNLERWQKCNCHGLQKQIQIGYVVREYDNKIWVYYKIGKMAKVSMTWITKTNAGLLCHQQI